MHHITQNNSSATNPKPIGTIHSIPVSEIIPMQNTPFQIRDDSSMNELIESISRFGILTPIEVRLLQPEKYEIEHHETVCCLTAIAQLPNRSAAVYVNTHSVNLPIH